MIGYWWRVSSDVHGRLQAVGQAKPGLLGQASRAKVTPDRGFARSRFGKPKPSDQAAALTEMLERQ